MSDPRPGRCAARAAGSSSSRLDVLRDRRLVLANQKRLASYLVNGDGGVEANAQAVDASVTKHELPRRNVLEARRNRTRERQIDCELLRLASANDERVPDGHVPRSGELQKIRSRLQRECSDRCASELSHIG